MNHRDFLKVGSVAGAGAIIIGETENACASAGERVSECVASVITSSAEMLRIVRECRCDLGGFDPHYAATILRTVAVELDRAAGDCRS
ncbi:MAG TPA: hypothetical protein VEK11_16625 [Thermoanaerobaculia bacterium]|nr:hypothetical protein [Thermoanaerobaculia bacterium]